MQTRLPVCALALGALVSACDDGQIATKALLPGQSEVVSVPFNLPAGKLGPFDFWVAVDDDGTGQGAETECHEDNNTATITGVSCPQIR